MPLTSKGKKIKKAMIKKYGKNKGESVFFASENSGKITGIIIKKRNRSKARGSN
jgi:hypothetical protein